MLNYIIYRIQTNMYIQQYYLINQLKTILSHIKIIAIPNKNDIIYFIQMAIVYIQKRQNTSNIIILIQNAIIALQQYIVT